MDILRRYFFLYTPHRSAYLLGGLFLAVTNAIALAIPRILGWAVDALDGGATRNTVLAYAGAIVGLAALQTLVRVGSRVFVLSVSRRIDYELKDMLHTRLLRLAPSFFGATNTGDLMSRLTNDVMLVRALGGPGVLYFFNAIFMYTLGLAYMLSISWRLTLAVFLPLPLIALFVRVLVHRVRAYVTSARVALSALNTMVQENLAGVMVVKSFGMEEAQIGRFEEHSRSYMDYGLREAWARAQMIPVVGLGGGIASVAVLGVGGRMVAAGTLSIGDLVAFLSYISVMVMPTVALGWILSLLQRGAAALERLDEVLASPVTITSPAAPRRLAEGPLSVRMDDLTFRYDEHLKHYGGILKVDAEALESRRRHALRAVDLDAPAGGYIAIVGRVGSGKSTLLKAVQHLIEVPAGSVAVGGVDVTEADPDELRRRVGYVPQDDFLFRTTVRDNIAYGRPGAAPEAVEAAAAAAGLSADLKVIPEGLDTVVGERGGTLSGGQRQRVALARAMLIDPDVLVLDNALSNVDAETEHAILGRLRSPAAAARRCTLIVASNRIGAIQDADRIYVMDAGRIVEHGTHEELLAAEGLYAAMYEQQRLSAALEEL
jgi:ATP-binding cassette subfamily B protein